MDVDDMLERLTPEQFNEWQAYLDGIGETDDQLNTATIAAAVVNELRELRAIVGARWGIKKPPKLVAADDYLRRWRKPEKPKKRGGMSRTERMRRLLEQHG